MNFSEILSKFKAVLLNQKGFFKKIRKEKTIDKGLTYFIILTAIIMLIVTNRYVGQINGLFQALYTELGLEFLNIQIEITPLIFIVFYLLFIIFFTVLAFARYWLVHITIKLYKPKALYKDTYNSLSYSITPGYLAVPFFAFGIFLLFFEEWRMLAIVLLIIYALLEGYSFYIRSKGLAETHSLTLWKGFACLYIYSNILLFAIFIVLLILLTFIAMFITYVAEVVLQSL